MDAQPELIEKLRRLDKELSELRIKDPKAYEALAAALRDTLAAINTELEKS